MNRKRTRLWLCCAVLGGTFALAGCTRVDHGVPLGGHRLTFPAGPEAGARVPSLARARTIERGRSVRGIPLVLELLGDGPERVFIFGGIHGNEPTSAYVAHELSSYLRAHPEVLAGRTVGILAEANPDGLTRGSRCNANGVDLNRNFPARNWKRSDRKGSRGGCRPGSEPETQAILRSMELLHPARVVSLHAATEGHYCNNYDGPARQLAQLMARTNRYPVKARMGYPTPGSFGSWAGIDRGIPTVTLELPCGRSGPQCWRENRDALLAFISHGAEPLGQ
jgi:protein MpaA